MTSILFDGNALNDESLAFKNTVIASSGAPPLTSTLSTPKAIGKNHWMYKKQRSNSADIIAEEQLPDEMIENKRSASLTNSMER